MRNGNASDNFYPEECNISYEWAERRPSGFHKPRLWINWETTFKSLEGEGRVAGGLFPTTIPGFVSKIDMHGLYLMNTNCVAWSSKLYKTVE